MALKTHRLKLDDRVTMPWGLQTMSGRVVEVWGDKVRVRLDFDAGDDPVVILVPMEQLTKA